MAEKGSNIDTNRYGLMLQAAGYAFAGMANKQKNDAEAALLRRRAREIRAAGQREAQETIRQGKQLKGQAVAQHAAAGGVMDTAMIERMARIEGEIDYNVMSSLYESELTSNATKFQAKQSEAAGKMSLLTGAVGAVPSILNYADTYGQTVKKQRTPAPIDYNTPRKRKGMTL
jgi:hypothetical protein